MGYKRDRKQKRIDDRQSRRKDRSTGRQSRKAERFARKQDRMDTRTNRGQGLTVGKGVSKTLLGLANSKLVDKGADIIRAARGPSKGTQAAQVIGAARQ